MRDAWLRNHFSIPVVETFLNVNTEQMANDIYEHSKNNKGMSAERKARKQRRIKRKGGTPVKMSIELTRPSYKQKGFGK